MRPRPVAEQPEGERQKGIMGWEFGHGNSFWSRLGRSCRKHNGLLKK